MLVGLTARAASTWPQTNVLTRASLLRRSRRPIVVRRGATLGIQGPFRHPFPVFAILKARPQDDTILGQVDAATGTADVSPAPAPPVGTAFFSERTRPNDVLVADVDGVVVGYAKLSQSIALPSHDHVLTLNGQIGRASRRE